jgi:hypothetical protein
MIVIILFHRLARTCKENNQRIWTFITKLPRNDTKNIYENTRLLKFTNIELLALQGLSGQIPRDLVKLTTLQVLQRFTSTSAEATMLQNLTNLRELVVEYASITSTQQRVISLDDLLKNHSKLTSFSIVARELHFLSKSLTVISLLVLISVFRVKIRCHGLFLPESKI